MARRNNPASISLPLIALGGLAAYLLLRPKVEEEGGGGDGGGGADNGGSAPTGAVEVRLSAGTGVLFINGAEAGPVSTARSRFNLPAGERVTLSVTFADGAKSTERLLYVVPGDSNPPQLFTSSTTSIAQQAYAAQIKALNDSGKTARATASQILAEAQAALRGRQYDQASTLYGQVITTYPGTPEAKAAQAAKGILDFQLQSVAGRAALDRANPLR